MRGEFGYDWPTGATKIQAAVGKKAAGVGRAGRFRQRCGAVEHHERGEHTAIVLLVGGPVLTRAGCISAETRNRPSTDLIDQVSDHSSIPPAVGHYEARRGGALPPQSIGMPAWVLRESSEVKELASAGMPTSAISSGVQPPLWCTIRTGRIWP